LICSSMVAIYCPLNQRMDQERHALPSASKHNKICLKEFRRQTVPRHANLRGPTGRAGCILGPVGKLPLFYLPYSIPNTQHSCPINSVNLSGSHQSLARIFHQSLIYMRLVLFSLIKGTEKGYCQRQVIYRQTRGKASTTKNAPDSTRVTLI